MIGSGKKNYTLSSLGKPLYSNCFPAIQYLAFIRRRLARQYNIDTIGYNRSMCRSTKQLTGNDCWDELIVVEIVVVVRLLKMFIGFT